jgi:O-succinylbenzoic acid--CoA ligase
MDVVDLLDFVRSDPETDWDNTVLVSRHTAYEWGGLEHRVDEARSDLEARGAEPGKIFTFEMEADDEGVITLLALWRMGVTPAPLNSRLTQAERDHAAAALAGQDAHGAQVVLWTSGTTGSPRGVALSWENLRAVHTGSERRLGSDFRDHWLASLSPAHVGGLALMVRALLLDSQLMALGRLTTEELSDLVDSSESLPVGINMPVDSLSLVPTQLHRLLEHREGRPPPATLKRVLLGGAYTPRPLLDRALAEGWPIALTYGMTEMSSQVATAPPEAVRNKPGSVGRPLDGVKLRIAEDGEILLGGETLALRYVGSGERLTDDDGWFHTGDLGHLDKDGDLWVTGRRTDRIITGGVNVDAMEVEEVLRGHPAVRDVCVVGIPDGEWGAVVAAWVLPGEGEFDLDDVDAWASEHLSASKRPRRWVVDREIPLNANGKVDRGLLRALIQEG